MTFQVAIDDVAGDAGETIAVDILNAGAVQSDLTPTTPSNEVVTPVTKVLGVKIPNEEPPVTSPAPCRAPGPGCRSVPRSVAVWSCWSWLGCCSVPVAGAQ